MMQVVADEVEELSNLAIIVTPVMEIVNTSGVIMHNSDLSLVAMLFNLVRVA